MEGSAQRQKASNRLDMLTQSVFVMLMVVNEEQMIVLEAFYHSCLS